MRLYNETSRSHTLMRQAVAYRARLEQTMLAGQPLLPQVQAQLGQLIPAGQTVPALDLLARLQNLLAAPSLKS